MLVRVTRIDYNAKTDRLEPSEIYLNTNSVLMADQNSNGFLDGQGLYRLYLSGTNSILVTKETMEYLYGVM